MTPIEKLISNIRSHVWGRVHAKPIEDMISKAMPEILRDFASYCNVMECDIDIDNRAVERYLNQPSGGMSDG